MAVSSSEEEFEGALRASGWAGVEWSPQEWQEWEAHRQRQWEAHRQWWSPHASGGAERSLQEWEADGQWWSPHAIRDGQQLHEQPAAATATGDVPQERSWARARRLKEDHLSRHGEHHAGGAGGAGYPSLLLFSSGGDEDRDLAKQASKYACGILRYARPEQVRDLCLLENPQGEGHCILKDLLLDVIANRFVISAEDAKRYIEDARDRRRGQRFGEVVLSGAVWTCVNFPKREKRRHR